MPLLPSSWFHAQVTFDEALQLVPDFQQATAELADTVAPLITKITELIAGLIEEFNQLSPEGQRLISNTSVTGDYDNLILIEGRNKIEITDGFELKVIPNWRRL